MLQTTKGDGMRARTKTFAALAAIGALGVGTVSFTAASSGQASTASSGASRLDDGKDLLPKSNITEEQAIRAAQTAASGDLNEVDLEHRAGRLVWNVDVGAKDVQVDAQTGDVAGASTDD
jgi:uncharacterized membrane protein YkoI